MCVCVCVCVCVSLNKCLHNRLHMQTHLQIFVTLHVLKLSCEVSMRGFEEVELNGEAYLLSSSDIFVP